MGIETYTNSDGETVCDNCDEIIGSDCVCCCVECGDHVEECGCPEGPSYPAV